MKRLVYGATIGLVGVLAVIAVKLPVTHEVSLPSDAGVLYGSEYIADFQNELEPLRPLVIARGAPSLPPQASEGFPLDEVSPLSLSNEPASLGLDLIDEPSEMYSYGETNLSGIEPSVFEDPADDPANSLICPEYESDTCSSGICDDMKSGFVLLDAVMKRHPLWTEVIRMEREIETCKGRWQSYVDASVTTEEDVLACLGVAEPALDETGFGNSNEDFKFPQYTHALESRLELVEAHLTEEAEARIRAKAIQVQAALEDRLYAERARLNNEFDEFKDRALKESYLAIVNTQMKLRLLKLSDTEREALQDELRHLNDDIEKELSAKQKALDDIYNIYETREIAEAEKELVRHRAEQVSWVSSRLQQEREKLAKEIEGFFAQTGVNSPGDFESWQEEVSGRKRIELSNRQAEMSREFAEREFQFTEELSELNAGRKQILDKIRKDIFHVVANLGDDMDIPIEVIEDDFDPGMCEAYDVDVTPDVISIIRYCE